jgi:hypothetical protein
MFWWWMVDECEEDRDDDVMMMDREMKMDDEDVPHRHTFNSNDKDMQEG